MALPVEILSDPTDWAGWFQAGGGLLAIAAAWWIGHRDQRVAAEARRREAEAQAEAIAAIIDYSLEVLFRVGANAVAGNFSSSNVSASQEAVEAAVSTLSSIPFLSLSRTQVQVVARVRQNMVSAQRRLEAIEGRISHGDAYTEIKFSELLRENAAERRRLGVATPLPIYIP